MRMDFKPDMDLSLKRLSAFWERELLDRPPIRIRYPIDGIVDHDWPRDSGSIESYCSYWLDICGRRALFADDSVPVCNGAMDANFMPAVLGCAANYGKDAFVCDHPLRDRSQLEELSARALDTSNPAIGWLENGIAYFSEQSRNRCAVILALLVGPADVMAALRSTDQLCLDLVGDPQHMHALAEICTQALLKVFDLQFERVPRLMGGYCDPYSLWTPGRSSFLCDDFSSLISPEMYGEFVFPYDCPVAENMESSWMHIYSSGIRILNYTMQIPNLIGVQICDDGDKGASIRDILPQLQKIQERHCLLLRKFPYEAVKSVLPELSPEGLCRDTQCDSRDRAEETLDDWSRLFA